MSNSQTKNNNNNKKDINNSRRKNKILKPLVTDLREGSGGADFR